MRTNTLALEEFIGAKVPIDHALISWLAEYSAWVCNTVKIGADGLPMSTRASIHQKAIVLRRNRYGPMAVSYTHLTLPTILRV